MKKRILNSVRYLLPVLFILYVTGITFFSHAHVVNGVAITHSHPFKKASAHSHTTLELHFIHLLTHPTLEGGSVLAGFLCLALILLCILSVGRQRFVYHSPYQGVPSLRAPPSVG